MQPNKLPADLVQAANRLRDWIRDNAEIEEGDRAAGIPRGVYVPDDLDARLYELCAEAMGSSDAGWGVWIVNKARWCNAAETGGAVLVYRSPESAEEGAKYQSRMYDLGPCEARPFDLAMELADAIRAAKGA